jgi:iron complex outermembrane receptor protein
MELTSACANHMNAPLSYIDPQQVQRIRLIAGVTPVSMGGDSIGGSIDVQSLAPVCPAGAGLLTQGSLAVSGRSVNNSVATSVNASAASDTLSIGYSGAMRGHSYDDGHGHTVLASMFESINQAIVLAAKGDGQQLTLRAGVQHIPTRVFRTSTWT